MFNMRDSIFVWFRLFTSFKPINGCIVANVLVFGCTDAVCIVRLQCFRWNIFMFRCKTTTILLDLGSYVDCEVYVQLILLNSVHFLCKCSFLHFTFSNLCFPRTSNGNLKQIRTVEFKCWWNFTEMMQFHVISLKMSRLIAFEWPANVQLKATFFQLYPHFTAN